MFSGYALLLGSGLMAGAQEGGHVSSGATFGFPVRLKYHDDALGSVAFSPDSKTLATASNDGTWAIWRLDQPQRPTRTAAHGGRLTVSEFFPSGEQLITASMDKRLLLWNVKDGDILWTVEDERDRVAKCARVTPDGKTLIVGYETGIIRAIDADSGKRRAALEGHEGPVYALDLAGTDRLISVGWDRTARVWSLNTGAELLRHEGHRAPVTAAACSRDGRFAVSAGGQAELRIWSTMTGEVLADVKGARDQYFSVSISPDGRLIAASNQDRTTRLWEAATAKPITVHKHQEAVAYVVRFSPDGRRLAAGMSDTTALIWTLFPPPPEPVDPARVPALVKALGAAEASEAYAAIGDLCSIGEPAIPALREALRLVPTDPGLIDRHVVDLGADDISLRQAAAKWLARSASPGAIKAALRPGMSPEVRSRLEEVLRDAERPLAWPPEELSVLRAVVALERIAGPNATAVLADCVKAGAPRVAREAEMALKRLASRSEK